MSAVLNIVIPVFGLGLIGYCAGKLGWFSSDAAAGLSKFVFNWAIPFMLVRVLVQQDLPSTFPWQLLVSFYLPAAVLYGFSMLAARIYFQRDFSGQVMTGFTSVFGNVVLLAIPLTLLTFGDIAAVPLFIIISIHGLSYLTLTTLLLEVGRNQQQKRGKLAVDTLRGLVTNPIIVALFLGFCGNRLNLELPTMLDRIAAFMQDAVLPCSLFSLGASLSGYRILGQIRQTLFVVTIKNLLFPALVWFSAVYFFNLPVLSAMVVTLIAAQPCGVHSYLIAQRYQSAQALAGTSVFISTAVSVFTLTALILFFKISAG